MVILNNSPFKPGQLVRLKTGLYSGSLAVVISRNVLTSDHPWAFIKLQGRNNLRQRVPLADLEIIPNATAKDALPDDGDLWNRVYWP